MVKKLSLIAFATILLYLFVIPNIYSFELNPFAVKKIYETSITDDMDTFIKTDFNKDYGVIRFSNTFFWIESDKIAEYSLTKSTDQCLINCEAYGKTILYKESAMFDNLIFYDKGYGEITIQNEMYYLKNISYDVDIPVTEKVCKENENKSGTEVCHDEVTGMIKETRYMMDYVPYHNEILPPGRYEWKIIANKRPIESIDLVPVAQGRPLDEWTWWDGGWAYKKAIKIQDLAGSSADNYTITITVQRDPLTMRSDMGDIRFTNGSENLELGMWMLFINGSEARFRVRLPDPLVPKGNQTIYMYYGNPSATTTSNIANAHLKGFDGETMSGFTEIDTGDTTSFIEVNSTKRWLNFTNICRNDKRHSLSGTMPGTVNYTYEYAVKVISTTAGNGAFDVGVMNQAGIGKLGEVTGDGVSNIFYVSSTKDWFLREWNGGAQTNTNPSVTTETERVYYIKVAKAGTYLTQNVTTGSVINMTRFASWTHTHTDGTTADNVAYVLFASDNANPGACSTGWITNYTVSKYVDPAPTYTFMTEESSGSLSISLSDPTASQKLNTSSTFFNFTFIPVSVEVMNYTFILYRGTLLNFTNLTIENFTVTSTRNKTYSLTDGSYTYGIYGCYNRSGALDCAYSSNRSFSIDLLMPTFRLNNLSNKTTLTFPVNVTLNVTTSDLNLETCQYSTSESSTRIAYLCNTTINVSFSSGGDKTITVYGIDTYGNSNQTSYNVRIYGYNVTTSAPLSAVEGNAVTFSVLINSTNFAIGDAEANLWFNRTNFGYTTKTILDSNAILLTKVITIPLGYGNATGRSINWSWEYNTTLLPKTNTTSKQITVYSVSIDDCSAYHHVIMNITLRDEETNNLVNISNVSTSNIEVDLSLVSKTNASQVWSFYKTWTKNNSVSICIPDEILNNTNFTIEMTAEYTATDHVTEFFYLENGTLSYNDCYFDSYTSCNISFMDLESADSTTFLFEFTDENGLEVEDAIVHTFRKYIGEGLFREVERSKQDDSGQTHLHLVEEDVIYYFVITQNGREVYTSSTYNAKCLADPCTIELSGTSDFNPFPTDWDMADNVSYSLTSNKLARTVTLTFTADQLTAVNLSLYRYGNGVIEYINSSQVSATSGTMTLNVPQSFGNNTFFASIFFDGDFIRSEWIEFKDKAQDYFGTVGAIMGGMIVLTVILMAVTEGIALVIFALLSLFFVGNIGLGLVDLHWTAYISIVIAGIIIIYKISNRRRR